ncbi:MAG: PAS domain-containing protein [Oligoflexia bacterium]|nr:PAS domain-containing protein [Oligoflexia bacterium]
MTEFPAEFKATIGRWPYNFFKRVTLGQLILLLVVYLLLAITIHLNFKKYIHQQAKQQLSQNLYLLKSIVSRYLLDDIRSMCLVAREPLTIPRITLITIDGTVICDSEHDPDFMENHFDRPEVIMAKSEEIGFAFHYSKTLDVSMLYGAILLSPQPYILRVSVPLSELDKAIALFDSLVFILFIPLVFLGPLFVLWFAFKYHRSIKEILFRMYQINRKTRSYSAPSSTHASISWNISENIEKILADSEENLDRALVQTTIENIKLNTLMETNVDAIVAIDNEQKITFANLNFQKNFLHGKAVSTEREIKICDLIRNQNVNDAFSSALKQLTPFFAHDISLTITKEDVNPDNVNAYFDLTVAPIVLKEGKYTAGALGVFHNIEERKKMEQVKLDFIHNFSHEVRTPLSAIQGFIQLFQQEMDTLFTTKESKGHYYLAKIDQNSKRMVRLFDNLLQLATIESKIELANETVPTALITDEAISLIAPKYKDKNITLNINIPSDAEDLYGDSFWLEQLLINLLDNAFKYTPPNGTIDISWKRFKTKEDKTADKILLEVKDSGVGIPTKYLDRIFERFFQIDPSRSAAIGTGLGLAIVKHIVQKHNGKIEVISKEGQGSCFRVIFN